MLDGRFLKDSQESCAQTRHRSCERRAVSSPVPAARRLGAAHARGFPRRLALWPVAT